MAPCSAVVTVAKQNRSKDYTVEVTLCVDSSGIKKKSFNDQSKLELPKILLFPFPMMNTPLN